MKTFLSLPYEHDTDLPAGEDSEVRTPPALVEHFLRAFTDPGEAVFDPFAGFGTTLAVAADLDRVPFGVELERERIAYLEERLAGTEATVRQADARTVDTDWLPPIDCCFTSPPFMVESMERDPLQNYDGESDYDEYLAGLETTFERVAGVLAPGGRVVVDVCNMKHEGRVTPLAWDVAEAAAETLHFQGEVVVAWEGEGHPNSEGAYGYGYDHSYCLVFDGPSE